MYTLMMEAGDFSIHETYTLLRSYRVVWRA